MKSFKTLLMIAVMVATFGIMTAGQTTVDDPNLKACEQVADALKLEKAKTAGLEMEVKLLREMLTLKDEKIVLVAEQATFWKKSYEDTSKVVSNDKAIIENLRIQNSEFKQELTSLRNENSSLRNSRTIRTFVGYGAGIATGYFIKK